MRTAGIAAHVLRHYPKSIDAHCALGEAHAERGDAGEAKKYFQLVLSADPENVTARVALGLVYREQGNLAGALVEMDSALELQPDNARLRREILRLRISQQDTSTDRLKPSRGMLGRIYLRSGLYTRAAKELRTVFDDDPSRLDAGAGLAEALWRAELFAEAAQVCHGLLEVAPDCLKAKLLLADMCSAGLATGDPRALIAGAQSLDPDNRLASVLFDGTPSASRWVVQPSDLPLPEESELVGDLEGGDEAAATSDQDGEQPEIPATEPVGGASEAVEEAGAEEQPEAAPAMVPRPVDARLGTARLRSVLVINPHDHPTRLSLAVVLGRLGEIEEAYNEFEYLLSSAPELRRGLISGLKELLDGGIDNPKLHRILADAYMKDGAFGEAIDHYALSLEKDKK